MDVAIALLEVGDVEGAISFLKRYVQKRPTDPRGWMLLSEIVDDLDIKRKCLERVLQLHPDSAVAHRKLLALDAQLEQKDDWLRTEVKEDDIISSGADLAKPSASDEWFQLSARPVKPIFDDAPPPVPKTEASPPNVAVPATMSVSSKALAKPMLGSRPKAVSGKKKANIWPWVYAALAVLVIGAAIFAVYFIFFAGPDLAETAENDYLMINYPRDWVDQGADYPNNMIVMSTKIIPTDAMNPWAVLTDVGLMRYATLTARYELQYWTHYFEWGRMGMYDSYGDPLEGFSPTMAFQRLRADELAIAIVQVVPGRAERPVDGAEYARVLSQWFESQLEQETSYGKRQIITEIEPVSIDGYDGTFTTIQFHNQVLGTNSYEAIYIANLTLGDMDYMLLFTGVERELGEWKETAFAMAESIDIRS